jgi:transposase InsO family protein
VLDAFSRMIVGWAIDSTQTTRLVLNALGMATQRREHRDGLVIHSDGRDGPRLETERGHVALQGRQSRRA